MKLNFLPRWVLQELERYEIEKIREIRIKPFYPILLHYQNKYINLCKQTVSDEEFIKIIKEITEYSYYAYGEQMKKGFITTRNGIRIGVAGQCVEENGQIITIKNIESLNVRIPHDVSVEKSCLKYFMVDEEIVDTLIVSKVGMGKTTILKCLAKWINDLIQIPILIIDERGEFEQVSGVYIDKISYANKNYAIENGIRSMSPQIILVDELMNSADWQSVMKAKNSGCKILASIHANSYQELVERQDFVNGVFSRYVLLNGQGRPGQIKEVYDFELKRLEL